MSRDRSSFGRIIVFTTWALFPLLAIVGMTLVAQSQLITASPGRITVPVTGITDEISRSATLALVYQRAPALRSSFTQGLVLQVYAEPGLLNPGDLVANIDGIDRIAVHTELPFYRALALRDSGADASSLNDVLASLGFSHTPGEVVTAATVQGIGQLSISLGFKKAVSSFDPSWIVWLPAPTYHLESINLEVGVPAPQSGDVLATAAPELVRAVLARAASIEESTDEQLPGAGRFEAVNADPEEALLLNGQVLRLDTQLSEVIADDLAVVSDLVRSGNSQVRVSLSRPATDGTALLPAAAISTSSSGEYCVFTSSGSDSPVVPVPVTVIANVELEVVVDGLQGFREVILPSSVPSEACL